MSSKKQADPAPIDLGLGTDDFPERPKTVDRGAAKSIAVQEGYGRSVDPTPAETSGAAVAAQDPAPTTVAAPAAAPIRIDGRSMRKTGRNEQLNAKVTERVRTGYLQLQQKRGVTLGELLEEGLELLLAKDRN